MDQDRFWVPDLGFCLNQGLHHLFADLDHDREAVIDMFPRGNATNPGNTLYVTGLSSRVTEKDLEIHFSKEGKVQLTFQIKRTFFSFPEN
ncbi:hypothetical protein ZIOFF_061270 [Zingiber officinale]|uniref:RRM domain-containing protein n=1 Tax=Zingiber officinale TaxID=94328 RepID=A0A8J5KI70_ZINOF|nr:hypothetical protein ZIOFF_061270 [Zingiber officinale]